MLAVAGAGTLDGVGGGLRLAQGAALVAVSDVHLGDPSCDVELFVDFLERGLPDDLAVLVLNGDVLDLWRAEPDEAFAVAAAAWARIEALRAGGVRVHYVIGNHDFPLLRALERQSELAGGPDAVAADPAAADFRVAPVTLPGRLPVDAWHHRYLPVVSGGRTVLIAHGDDVDFRWAAKTVLRAERVVERYYDWMATQDRDVVRAWKKEDLRKVFAAWVALRRAPGSAAPGADGPETAADVARGGDRASTGGVARLAEQLGRIAVVDRAAQNLGGVFGRVSARATVLLEQLLRPDPMAVWDRVRAAAAWARYPDVGPYPEPLGAIDVAAVDHVLCGHLHRPAMVGTPTTGVTITGAWVVGHPEWRPAYAVLRDGAMTLAEHRRAADPLVLAQMRIGWAAGPGAPAQLEA